VIEPKKTLREWMGEPAVTIAKLDSDGKLQVTCDQRVRVLTNPPYLEGLLSRWRVARSASTLKRFSRERSLAARDERGFATVPDRHFGDGRAAEVKSSQHCGHPWGAQLPI
jgi:hypothetical protein